MKFCQFSRPSFKKRHFRDHPIQQNGIFETPYTNNCIFKTPYTTKWHFQDPLYKKWHFQAPPIQQNGIFKTPIQQNGIFETTLYNIFLRFDLSTQNDQNLTPLYKMAKIWPPKNGKIWLKMAKIWPPNQKWPKFDPPIQKC